MKPMTIRQFCKENKLDLPVVIGVCERLEIKKSFDELWIFSEESQLKIKSYISDKSDRSQIRKRNDMLRSTCICGFVNEYCSEQINDNTRMWIICDCGKKIEVTRRMQKIN